MEASFTDTSPEAEQVQIALLRKASDTKHFQVVSDLSQMALQLSWRGLQRLHPDASEQEIRLRSVALNYGQALADCLAAMLEERPIMSIPPTILAAIMPVIDAFEQLGVAYYIGGSVASSIYGMPRSTLDVDLIADLRQEQVQPLVARLQDAYYLDEEAMRKAIQRRSSCNLIHLATMLKVDVFVARARPFDREAFQRIQQSRASEAEPDRMLALSSAEHMVLAKLEWYRMGNEISERQWNDVLGILKVQGVALDTAYLRRWAADLRLADLLERALTEANLAG
ncbi:MAG TPA: hypothetical protein VH599_10365 [Ktedonobacterales bacterium]|jgi:hypothetical protein